MSEEPEMSEEPKKTKKQILEALEAWLDTPAKNSALRRDAGDPMLPDQGELYELDDIISDIVDYRIPPDYSGWSLVKQHSLYSKHQYDVIDSLVMRRPPKSSEDFSAWDHESVDEVIRDIAGHICQCSEHLRLWMRLKHDARRNLIDKKKQK